MNQRPIYIISNDCNNPKDIKSALKERANAIECEASKSYSAEHNVSDWHIGAKTIREWTEEVGKLANKYSSQFALIVCQIGYNKGDNEDFPDADDVYSLVSSLRRGLPRDLYLLFTISEYKNRDAFNKILKNLRPNEGVAFTGNNSAGLWNHFKHYGTNHYWYGNGAAATWSLPDAVIDKLKEACRLRDEDSKYKKILAWTVVKESTIDMLLRAVGVDALVVSKSNVKKVIARLAIKRDLRPATRGDNAFKIIKNAKYKLKFVTSDISGAGTDSDIYMSITGSKGSLSSIRLNQYMKGNAFERGKIDTLDITAMDVGTITSIRLTSSGEFAGASWHLAYVRIVKNGQKKYFGFNKWIKKNTRGYSEKASSTFPYSDYKFTIKTTNRSGAGTDSNITLTVYGSKGKFSVKANPKISGNAFERGDRESFTLKYQKKIGTLKSITVKSDGKYAGSDWHLSYIKVGSKKASFNKWIGKGSYKAKLK